VSLLEVHIVATPLAYTIRRFEESFEGSAFGMTLNATHGQLLINALSGVPCLDDISLPEIDDLCLAVRMMAYISLRAHIWEISYTEL
jgi:hypothetical protein